MQNFDQFISLTNKLQDQCAAYQQRQTKAESKRMRATIMEMKKLATGAKNDLLEADKG